MKNNIPLHKLPIGKKADVSCLTCDKGMVRRMLDYGIMQGTKVTALHKSPLGDPVAYLVRGAVIALRSEDAAHIMVEI